MPRITPNLWFDAEAAKAAERYTTIFDDAAIGSVMRYDEASAAASGKSTEDILSVEFELEGLPFVAINGGPQFTFNPSISFIVNCPSEEDVDALWDELVDGGQPMMPLDTYEFSARYGWTADTYGVTWQLIHREDINERAIVPSLMFVGENVGRAEEAIEYYTTVFDDARVNSIARYGPGEPDDEEGHVMYADFTLSGQPFAAMDSGQPHDFTFNEAISLSVECEDQEEVDYLWNALTADGGEAGQCAWLTDTFGVSWQIVPSRLTELLQDEDAEKAGRVAEAMFQMQKIDIATLEQAYAK